MLHIKNSSLNTFAADNELTRSKNVLTFSVRSTGKIIKNVINFLEKHNLQDGIQHFYFWSNQLLSRLNMVPFNVVTLKC